MKWVTTWPRVTCLCSVCVILWYFLVLITHRRCELSSCKCWSFQWKVLALRLVQDRYAAAPWASVATSCVTPPNHCLDFKWWRRSWIQLLNGLWDVDVGGLDYGTRSDGGIEIVQRRFDGIFRNWFQSNYAKNGNQISQKRKRFNRCLPSI